MEGLKQLLLILDHMLEANSQLLLLAKEKKKLLMGNEIQVLQNLIQRELILVDELQKLERQRISCVKDCMSSFGVFSETFTLEELLNLLDGNFRDFKMKLSNIAKDLRNVMEEIGQINEMNQQLIQTSLSYLDYSMGILVPKEPAIGYGPQNGKRYSSLLDAKI